jgi:hypothetical protein
MVKAAAPSLELPSSAHTATTGVTWGRLSARTVVSQKSSAASIVRRVSSQAVATASGSLYRRSSMVTGVHMKSPVEQVGTARTSPSRCLRSARTTLVRDGRSVPTMRGGDGHGRRKYDKYKEEDNGTSKSSLSGRKDRTSEKAVAGMDDRWDRCRPHPRGIGPCCGRTRRRDFSSKQRWWRPPCDAGDEMHDPGASCLQAAKGR